MPKRKTKRDKTTYLYSIIIVVAFLFLILMLVFDYVYINQYHPCFLGKIYDGIIHFLKIIGISRTKALSILESNLGVLVTMLSMGLTIGIDIKNSLESRVFGIPQKELKKKDKIKNAGIIRVSVYFFPLIMILFMNLRFCASGYTVLVYNYLILIFQYRKRTKSQDMVKYCKDVIDKLLSYIEGDHSINEDSLLEFQSFLGDVRRGIDKEEGWRYAEQLSVLFIKKIMEFDCRKCFTLSWFYFDGIFPISRHDDYEELRFTKMWLRKMLIEEYDDIEEWNKRQLVLWSILSRTFIFWKEELVKSFLDWFCDFANRSIQIKESGNSRSIMLEMKKQAGIVLIFTEGWLKKNIGEIKYIQFERNLCLLWDYGIKIFQEDITFFENGCLWLYKFSIDNEASFIEEAKDVLNNDYTNNWRKSHIRNFIKINQEDKRHE